MGRLIIPTLIFLEPGPKWVPAARLSEKIDAWRTGGQPLELVVFQTLTMVFTIRNSNGQVFGYWVESNEEAATDASRRMREFLNRRVNLRAA